MAKIKPFVEIYGYYRKGDDVVNYQIHVTNIKAWENMALNREPTEDDADAYAEATSDVENGYEVINSPTKYGVVKVYADSEDKKWLNAQGIKTKPMSNSLFVEIPKTSWYALGSITTR